MKTRQGVARRLASLTLVGSAGVLGLTAGLAFGLHQDAGKPTGHTSNSTNESEPPSTPPQSPVQQPKGAAARTTAQLLELVASFGGEKCFTRPCRDSVMGFSQSTRVAEIAVAGGQTVKKGALMIRGEDEEEVARLQLQNMRAESTLSVEKAKKAEELAKSEYDRMHAASSSGAGSPQELDRALLNFEGSEIDFKTAVWNQDQEVIAVRLAQARLDRVRIVAPFDCTVDIINVDVGQSVNENDKVMRVVDTSVLWLDVGVPTGLTIELGLTEGAKAWTLMNLPGEVKVFEGKIIEVSPVADPSSNTRRVRVAIQNPTKIVAGVTSWVRFTDPGDEWKSRIVPEPAIIKTASAARTGEESR